jgi:hypothetical protein
VHHHKFTRAGVLERQQQQQFKNLKQLHSKHHFGPDAKLNAAADVDELMMNMRHLK